ncbi:unnamed protein product, partial [Owenia fusiformis]
MAYGTCDVLAQLSLWGSLQHGSLATWRPSREAMAGPPNIFSELQHSKLKLPQELCSMRSHLQDSAGQCLSFHQRGWVQQLLFLHQLACNTCWHGCLAWWDDQTHPAVTATSHSSSSSINHEAYQETEIK